MTRLLTLLAVLGLLVGACGDDDDAASGGDPAQDEATASEDETETGTDEETESGSESEDTGGPYTTEDYAAVMAADLRTGDSFPGTAEQVECVSAGFIEAIGGADALNEAGLTPDELAAAEGPDDLGVELDEEAVADELVASFDECEYDLIRLLTEALGADAPEGFEDCVRGELTNDDVAAVFARLIIDPTDQQAADAIIPKIEGCASATTEG